jgi:FkbM family methyltransferase
VDRLSDTRPLHVLWRKLRWKSHWVLLPQTPMTARWWGGMRLVLPHSGAAATAFYRTFPSEVIARWIFDALQPGMTVIDVGAHVGVYSLFAARLVGPNGVVHAVEPQGALLDFVESSADMNQLENLRTHAIALTAADGEVGFEIDQQSMGGKVVQLGRASGSLSVPSSTLSSFCAREGINHVNLLKLDAAGNECAVLDGATATLESDVEQLICKLYHPDVIRDRFGSAGGPFEVVRLLRKHHFEVCLPGGRPATDDSLRACFEGNPYSVPALARRARNGTST